KFLDRRLHRRQTGWIDVPFGAGKAEPVLQSKEAVALRLLVLDGKADEIVRRLASLPVHRDKGHAVAAMELQRKERRRVLSADFKFPRHRNSPLAQRLLTVRSNAGSAPGDTVHGLTIATETLARRRIGQCDVHHTSILFSASSRLARPR